jgi:adenylate cyclase
MKQFYFLLFIFISAFASGQNASDDEYFEQLDRALNELQRDRTMRISRKNDILDSLYAIASQRKDKCHQSKIWISRAVLKDRLGELDSATQCLVNADRLLDANCDPTLFAEWCYVNSGVQISLYDFVKADSLASLVINGWNSSWTSNKNRRMVLFNAYSNKAIAVASMGQLDEAMVWFDRTMNEALEYDDSLFVEKALINKGTIASMRKSFDEAEGYYITALESAKKRGDNTHIIELYLNLSALNQEKGNLKKAIEYLNLASSAAEPMDLLNRKSIEQSFAVLYTNLGDWKEAYQHRLNYEAISDSILSQELYFSVSEIQEKYQSEKRIREIQDLKLSNLDTQLESEKVKRSRNAMIAGAGLLFISLVFLFTRYRIVELNRNKLRRKNEIIEMERKRSDDLLKNILPEEVAEELKAKGEAQASLIDVVTVLFTDFKGFTAMSEILSPRDLVSDLNECFSAFDRITEKFGIEKIKTIGDAYMAAGGLPTANNTHATDVLRAAMEMRDLIEEMKIKKRNAGLPFFEIRIGIHSGPVVAGIVGLKKFQYDIWGDTVNTASRMESSGAVGKVNISDTTFQLVHENAEFKFEPRGLIAAKGKGELRMYFAEYA